MVLLQLLLLVGRISGLLQQNPFFYTKLGLIPNKNLQQGSKQAKQTLWKLTAGFLLVRQVQLSSIKFFFCIYAPCLTQEHPPDITRETVSRNCVSGNRFSWQECTGLRENIYQTQPHARCLRNYVPTPTKQPSPLAAMSAHTVMVLKNSHFNCKHPNSTSKWGMCSE